MTPRKTPPPPSARQLARLRLAANFSTQQALAARFGLSVDVVAKAESGKQPPSPPVWDMWMDLCKVPESERATLEALLKLARKARGPIRSSSKDTSGTRPRRHSSASGRCC